MSTQIPEWAQRARHPQLQAIPQLTFKQTWNQWPTIESFVFLFIKLSCAGIIFTIMTTIIGFLIAMVMGTSLIALLSHLGK